MNRRSFLSAALAAPMLCGPASSQTGGLAAPFGADHPLQQSWQAWKTLCLAPEGRVVDGFQGNASHSEGQGYGLALAALFGDGEAVSRIIDWTETNLAVREDALLAWRWLPDRTPRIPDRNNASDGDLFYAWGLILSAAQGEAEAKTARAEQITRDLVRRCTAPWPDGSSRQVLLPGVSGFRRPEGIVVNPSYYMPLAMHELASACAMPELSRLADDGNALIADLAARGPIPDWVMLTAAGIAPAPQPFSGVSGYEAVRVPLFALWSGQAQSPAVRSYADMTAAAEDVGGAPTVFDPAGQGVFERSTHPGYGAVAALANCATTNEVGALMPGFTADQPYYPATLHLMALVAQASTFPRCVPI